MGNTLLVCIVQEQFQRRPICLDAIGKKFAAKHLLHARRVRRQPRHWIARHRGIEDPLETVTP